MPSTRARRDPSTSDHSHELLVLESSRIEKQHWKDLWCYWDVSAILVWSDIAVRCKQTFIWVGLGAEQAVHARARLLRLALKGNHPRQLGPCGCD